MGRGGLACQGQRGPSRVNLSPRVHLTPRGRFPLRTRSCVVISALKCAHTQPTSDLKHANLKHIRHSPETRKLIKLLNHLHFKTSLYSVELQTNEADLRNNLGAMITTSLRNRIFPSLEINFTPFESGPNCA